MRLYAGNDADTVECRRQLERCRAAYRPNQTLSFFVDERDGHDDYVISLALTVAAAADAGPRRARGGTRPRRSLVRDLGRGNRMARRGALAGALGQESVDANRSEIAQERS